MASTLFRPIPGFEKWSVNKSGVIYDNKSGKRIRTYLFGDRYFASYPGEKTNHLVGVHRAVALAWVENDNPSLNTVVNHLDGDPLNNYYTNLEWTTASGNNYHAVNTGLRPDCTPCKVRDFHTKEIREFPSIAQAADFMKLDKTTSMDTLRPRRFGSLIAGRYEFRLKEDTEPFFYEGRDEIISPSRYMLEVEEEDGSKRYVFKNIDLMKRYQLYSSPYGRSLPGLVKYAREMYPNKKFKLRDGYEESNHSRENSRKRIVATTRILPVVARKDGEELKFPSMAAAAAYFNVDKDVIKLRMSNPESRFLGWSFEGEPISVPIKRLLVPKVGEEAVESESNET